MAATTPLKAGDGLRHDWSIEEITALFERPFNDLLFEAQTIHREHFDPNRIQVSSLLSIKTGSCPEDCGYCPQSAHHDTFVGKERLLDLDEVLAAARNAKEHGAGRFCMGAAWRKPSDKDFQQLLEMVREVKALGMQTCMTLGMLSEEQARELGKAGLDYYNHNLDTSPEFYGRIVTTRSYQDRLDTLDNVRRAGVKLCVGGIVGMGESRRDRASMLRELANLPQHPESVPINNLVRVEGTPLADTAEIDPLEFVRTIAVARILMPRSYVRLSAGRAEMSDEMQALCFLAGANSMFYGEKLLTTDTPGEDHDLRLMQRLGMAFEEQPGHADVSITA